MLLDPSSSGDAAISVPPFSPPPVPNSQSMCPSTRALMGAPTHEFSSFLGNWWGMGLLHLRCDCTSDVSPPP